MGEIRYIKTSEADIELLMQVRLEMLREVNDLSDEYVYDETLVAESRKYFENGNQTTVLGYLDDIILLPMLVALTIKFIPQDVLERNRKQAEGMWQEGKPKKWYYAIPIIVIWLIIIGLILKAVLGGLK